MVLDRPWRDRALLGALGALAILAVGACVARDPAKLCQGESDCRNGSACIVGRCRPLADPPIATEARRIVLMPADVALLSSKRDERVEVDAAPFGRATLGDVVLLLRFDAALGDDVKVDSAVLTLTPPEHPPAPATPVALSVAPVKEPWASDALSWARQPPLGLAETVSAQPSRGRIPLRIDVTHLVRATGGAPNGIAVLATGSDAVGELYATGLGAGTPPRLELYVSDKGAPRSAPSASASASASAAPSASASEAASATETPEEAPPRPHRPKTPPKKPLRPRR